jgi:hypothetical protein
MRYLEKLLEGPNPELLGKGVKDELYEEAKQKFQRMEYLGGLEKFVKLPESDSSIDSEEYERLVKLASEKTVPAEVKARIEELRSKAKAMG